MLTFESISNFFALVVIFNQLVRTAFPNNFEQRNLANFLLFQNHWSILWWFCLCEELNSL